MVTATLYHYDYNQTSCPCNSDCRTISQQLQPHVLPEQQWLPHFLTTTMTTRHACAMVTATLSYYDYNPRSCPWNCDCNTIKLQLRPHVLPVQWWLPHYLTTNINTSPNHAIVTATQSHYDYDQTSYRRNCVCHTITIWLRPNILPVQWWMPHYLTTNTNTRPAHLTQTATLSNCHYDHTSCLCNDDCHTIILWLQRHVLSMQYWLPHYHIATTTTHPVCAMVTATLSYCNYEHLSCSCNGDYHTL